MNRTCSAYDILLRFKADVLFTQFCFRSLINKMQPGSVKKVNTKGGGFALMENLAAFQKAIKTFGVPEEEIFQTVDLFEARNVKAVVKCLLSLGRTVSESVTDR